MSALRNIISFYKINPPQEAKVLEIVLSKDKPFSDSEKLNFITSFITSQYVQDFDKRYLSHSTLDNVIEIINSTQDSAERCKIIEEVQVFRGFTEQKTNEPTPAEKLMKIINGINSQDQEIAQEKDRVQKYLSNTIKLQQRKNSFVDIVSQQ